MTIWKPDTCNCMIEYDSKILDEDSDPEFIKVVEVCKEHNRYSDKKCYKEILKHNRFFNKKYGNFPSNTELLLIKQDKRNEKLRIKNLV